MTYTNTDLNKFLRALDKADVDVTDWEATFIESNLERTQFSDKQRELILKLIERYGERVK